MLQASTQGYFMPSAGSQDYGSNAQHKTSPITLQADYEIRDDGIPALQRQCCHLDEPLLNTAEPLQSAWSQAAPSLDCGVMGGLQLAQLLLMLLQLSCQALQLLCLALSLLLGLLGAPAG